MKIRYLYLLIVTALILIDRPAHALAIEDQTDIMRWQYENPGKKSAKHRLSDRLAAPLLEYTHAQGPVYIKTAFGKRLDGRCATIHVSYDIEKTLRRDGQRVTYSQVVPVPFCKDGAPYSGHLSRPDTAGFYAEQEAASASSQILKEKK